MIFSSWQFSTARPQLVFSISKSSGKGDGVSLGPCVERFTFKILYVYDLVFQAGLQQKKRDREMYTSNGKVFLFYRKITE